MDKEETPQASQNLHFRLKIPKQEKLWNLTYSILLFMSKHGVRLYELTKPIFAHIIIIEHDNQVYILFYISFTDAN